MERNGYSRFIQTSNINITSGFLRRQQPIQDRQIKNTDRRSLRFNAEKRFHAVTINTSRKLSNPKRTFFFSDIQICLKRRLRCFEFWDRPTIQSDVQFSLNSCKLADQAEILLFTRFRAISNCEREEDDILKVHMPAQT